jgi:hypothetical protein
MPLKTYLFFAFLFYFCNVTFAWLGVWLADRLNLGELVFEGSKDLKKMALASFIALPVPLAILFFARSPGVVMIYIFIFFICLKLAYLSIGVAELGIIICTTLIGAGVFRIIVVSKLLIFLYITALVAGILYLFNRSLTKKGDAKKRQQFEKNRERALRQQIQRDARFKTYCYQCKYYHPQENTCVLDPVSGKKEITISVQNQPIKYCLYWEPAKHLKQKQL